MRGFEPTGDLGEVAQCVSAVAGVIVQRGAGLLAICALLAPVPLDAVEPVCAVNLVDPQISHRRAGQLDPVLNVGLIDDLHVAPHAGDDHLCRPAVGGLLLVPGVVWEPVRAPDVVARPQLSHVVVVGRESADQNLDHAYLAGHALHQHNHGLVVVAQIPDRVHGQLWIVAHQGDSPLAQHRIDLCRVDGAFDSRPALTLPDGAVADGIAAQHQLALGVQLGTVPWVVGPVETLHPGPGRRVDHESGIGLVRVQLGVERDPDFAARRADRGDQHVP